MKTMRPNNRETKKIPTIMMSLGMTLWAVGPTLAQAEPVQTAHSTTCRSGGTDDLNRWPLRGQDVSGCVETRGEAPVLVRRPVQESALNLWPYAPRPQKSEFVEAVPNEEEKDQPTIHVRTEPDLRMWPLWPKS